MRETPKEQPRENKMGTMPIPKLLLSMSIPIMISMLVQALYNIVDSMFVARLSEDALTAVSLAFPVQNFMIAVGTGTGVGVNALVSRALGEKNQERANKTAGNGLYLAIFSGIFFLIMSQIFGRSFFAIQTDVGQIVDYGEDYITIVAGFSCFLFLEIMMERLLQSTGRTVDSMITQLAGAITNIILDPIMIFGLFGFPRMEVAGAALATITGQGVGVLLGFILNIKRNKELTISFKRYTPQWKFIKRIYAIGIPSIIMVSVGSIMNFFMNKILLTYATTAAAVFGVYFKLQSFVFMPIFGLNNGMVPIVGYNYGARKKERITQTLRLAILYALCIMILGTILFETQPARLLSIFSASENMLSIGVPAMRIIAIHFCLGAFSIVCSSFFQALGHGGLSLLNSLIRQLFVLLPCAYLLSKIGGLGAVWWSFPIAELVAVILCAAFLKWIYGKEIDPL